MKIGTGIIAAAAVLGVVACGRGTRQSNVDDNMVNKNAQVTLQVTNDNPQDVDVFASSGGRGNRQRLGMVTSGQTQTFTVSPTVARASNFRVMIHPIGGGGDYSTGQLNINPGD